MADDCGGYNYDTVGETYHHLFCPLCLHLMKDAQQLACGHGMCQICLEKLFLKSQNSQVNCPVCRTEIEQDKVVSAQLLDYVIRTVQVICPNKEMGCGWNGEINDVQDHLNKYCQYAPVSCLFEQCTEEILRHDLKQHLDVCMYRTVLCCHCDTECVYSELKEHYEVCDLMSLRCLNECEVGLLQRNKIEDHLEYCLLRIISCPFSNVGCNVTVIRKESERHALEAVQDHLQLILKQNIWINTRFAEVTEELKVTKTQLVSVTSELDKIKMENKAKLEKISTQTANEIATLNSGLQSVLSEISSLKAAKCTSDIAFCMDLFQRKRTGDEYKTDFASIENAQTTVDKLQLLDKLVTDVLQSSDFMDVEIRRSTCSILKSLQCQVSYPDSFWQQFNVALFQNETSLFNNIYRGIFQNILMQMEVDTSVSQKKFFFSKICVRRNQNVDFKEGIIRVGEFVSMDIRNGYMNPVIELYNQQQPKKIRAVKNGYKNYNFQLKKEELIHLGYIENNVMLIKIRYRNA